MKNLLTNKKVTELIKALCGLTAAQVLSELIFWVDIVENNILIGHYLLLILVVQCFFSCSMLLLEFKIIRLKNAEKAFNKGSMIKISGFAFLIIFSLFLLAWLHTAYQLLPALLLLLRWLLILLSILVGLLAIIFFKKRH